MYITWQKIIFSWVITKVIRSSIVKVNLNQQFGTKNVNFEGIKPVKSDTGFKEYEFSFPFDDKNFDCYLEIYPVSVDEHKNFIVDEDPYTNLKTGNKYYRLTSGSNKINLAKSYQISNNEDFAYHYKLLPKGTDPENYQLADYQIEAGTVVYQGKAGHQRFNIYTPSSNNSHGGAMKLIVPDTYNAGFVYDDDGTIIPRRNMDKLFKSTRSFANKIGGSLAGVEKDVKEGKFKEYSRIISTPIFTDDSLSGHAYWNKNCMQMAQSLGNIDNYRSLQKAMFAKGLNFVSDGAFVNEGLEGVHFKHVLRWGDKSPYFNWFRISGLKDSPLTLGVFAKNKYFIGHRVVNPKYEYTQNPDGSVKRSRVLSTYESNKPTYIQVYDTRLVDPEKLDSQKLIKSYDKISTNNPLEISTHNDTVVPYSFEINPDTYDNSIKELNQFNAHAPLEKRIYINTPQGARFLTKFENFELEDKFECGFETWDANADIAKLNYVFSNTDTKELGNLPYEKLPAFINNMKHKNYEVQDYAIKSGEYWTKKTSQILNLHVAQNLKNIEADNPQKVYNTIISKINDGVFPEKLKNNISKDVVTNILNRNYKLKNNVYNDKFDNIVLATLMDVPLDSFELGDSITAVFASPYMSKYATSDDFLGKTRYELYKRNNPQVQPEYLELYQKTNSLYEKEMSNFTKNILVQLDKEQKDNQKIISYPNATEYGKFVLPTLISEIAKYAVIKGLFPDAQVKVNDNGEISYDYEKLKSTSLTELGIIASSPKDEAKCVINKLKSGINHLNKNKKAKEELVEALKKSLKGTDSNSFALAEAIVDRTQSGLDWRIDATKDIGDVEAIRKGNTDFEYTWDQVINFWKHFTKGVLKGNENAYMAAEITDEGDLYSSGEGEFSQRFNHIDDEHQNNSDLVAKFLRETRMTAMANYRYFFSPLPEMFAQDFETGKTSDNNGNRLDKLLFTKLVGTDNFLQSAPLQSLIYSYTFIGNHDKPRALHCMALDMGMFFSLKGHEQEAYRMIRNNFFEDINQEDFEKFKKYEITTVSSKNIAMAYAVRDGFIKVLDTMLKDKQINQENYEKTFKAVNDAISDLANGKFEGDNFEADAFGFKPFDVTIDVVLRQAEEHGLKLNDKDKKTLSDRVFRQILEPANKKLLAMLKMLVALPGNPTLYAGDDLQSTGFEFKSKNITLDNRSYLHHEWTDPDHKSYQKFVAEYEKEYAKVMGTRARKELRALNDGTPFTLDLQKGYYENGNTHPVTAVLHHNTDGAMVLSLFNTAGIERNHKADYNPQTLYLNSIDLYQVENSEKIGLPKGLQAAEQGDDGKFYGNGIILKNADENDKSIYKVCRSKEGLYFVKRYVKEDNGNVHEASIELNDTTMNLYYDPKNPNPSFTGHAMPKRRVMYNPQYHFGNPYANLSKQYKLGENLALISK